MEIHDTYRKIATAFGHYEALLANLHEWTTPPGRTYSQEEIEVIQQSQAAIKFMENNINEARQMASDLASTFE